MRIDCLFKNTDIVDDVKTYVKYLGGFHAKIDGSASFESIYKKLRSAGVEIDAKSAAMIYADVLPRGDERFTSNEDLEHLTGQSMSNTVRNLLLRERPEGEKQIGDLSPAEAVVKNLADAFTNNTVTDPRTKSMLKTMQEAYLATAKKLLGELPNKPGGSKDTRPFEQIIKEALDKESMGYADKTTGEINGFKKIHEAAVAKMKEISAEVKNSNDPVLQEQWEAYAKSFEDSAYTLMFSTKEGKKVLQEALMSKEGGEFVKESADGTRRLDWGKLAGSNNDFSKLRENVVKAFEAKGFDEATANKVADSLSKEFDDLRKTVAEKALKSDQNQAPYAGLFDKEGKVDNEAERLQANANRAKSAADIQLQKDRDKNMSGWAKAQNWFVSLQRAFKLSGPLILGKLTAAAATRAGTTPLEDVVGGVYSKLLPKLAKGAIGEGGWNVKQTARGFSSGFMKGINDMGAIMNSKEVIRAFKNHEIKGLKSLNEALSRGTQGKSDIEAIYAKYGDVPPEMLDFFGHLHSALKAPIKRMAFERNLRIRSKNYLANGVDVTSPLVQTKIGNEAYQDANRFIFMQDNKVADGYQSLVKWFENHDAKPTATAMQWLIPFVKVPSNIVAETGTHIYGVPVAAYKLIKAGFTTGIENLPQEQKDVIMRNLKKGSIGLAALALGYFNPQNFGGYYQAGQKREDDDAQAMGTKFFGIKLPPWLTEAPIFQAMQFGSTIRRIADHYTKGERTGETEGLISATFDLLQENPLASQPLRVGGLFKSSSERKYYFDELVKSALVPAGIEYIAKATDPADEGSWVRKALDPQNKRKSPKTLLDHIKSGIPFLREDLEEK